MAVRSTKKPKAKAGNKRASKADQAKEQALHNSETKEGGEKDRGKEEQAHGEERFCDEQFCKAA